jgi:ribonuclease J
MVYIIDTAQQLGCISIPENTLIPIDNIKDYPEEKTVIITTGSQGESMAALSRMASGNHKKVTIGSGDTVIFSSNPIPGNEKAVTKVINELLAKGAEVIFQDAHVSGHACQEEIKLIYTLVRPKYAIPVHGEYKHLKAQARLASELGIADENIFLLTSGSILELDAESARVSGKVQTGDVLVDGLGVGDVGNVVLRDRQMLSNNGIMIAVFAMDGAGQLVSGPEIITRGFIYVRESDALMNEMTELAYETVNDLVTLGITDWSKIKSKVKQALGEYVWNKTNRKPVILPVILEV